MNAINFYYVTEYGSEWLNEKIVFEGSDLVGDNWKYKVDKYVLENKSEAKKLENKWRANGEDVSLFLDCETNPFDTSCDMEFFRKVASYMDALGE